MPERDFNQIMDDLKVSEDENIDKISEVADNASPEEVEALKELFEEGDKADSSSTDEKDNADDKTDLEPEKKITDEEKPKDQAEDDKELEKETKEEPGEVIPLDTKPITISDDYISKADEKDRNILQAIKGEMFSPKGLQNYINAQRKIGELGTKLGEQSKQTEKEIPAKIVPETFPKQQFTEEVEKLKEVEILNRLRKSFPDLPEDLQEAKEYINSLPQSDFYRYMKKEDSMRDEVEQDFNKAVYYQEHQPEINTTIIKNDIDKIIAELKEDGIEDPAKFGLDLTIIKDANGKSNNALLQELITTDGKTMDKSLVTFVGNVPIFNEGAIYNKFFAIKRGVIRDIIRKKTSIDSRKEAFNELKKHGEDANNTASVEKSGGVTGNKYKGKDLDKVDDLNPSEVEELKREMEKE